jgi:hypothetical protein
MAYIITDHAARRMQKRGITRQQVEETIEQPQMQWLDKKMKDRHIHVRTYDEGLLKVVWIPKKNDAYIVTTFWLQEGGKP